MSEPPILAVLEAVQNGKGVRVEFTKIENVISHTIYLVNDGEKTAALISQVNQSNLPCFTELHQQGDTLFLTGADGPCHWSMSVERRETSPSSVLLFDVACRIKQAVLALGTEYSVLMQSGLGIDPLDEDTKVKAIGDSQVRILSAIAAPASVPATVRWKYQTQSK